MKHRKLYRKILSSTLVGTMLISNVGVVLGNTQLHREGLDVSDKRITVDHSVKEDVEKLQQVGEDIITLKFNKYEVEVRLIYL